MMASLTSPSCASTRGVGTSWAPAFYTAASESAREQTNTWDMGSDTSAKEGGNAKGRAGQRLCVVPLHDG